MSLIQEPVAEPPVAPSRGVAVARRVLLKIGNKIHVHLQYGAFRPSPEAPCLISSSDYFPLVIMKGCDKVTISTSHPSAYTKS